MIEIRRLTTDDMQPAIELKALCWPEELAGLSDHPFDFGKELTFWTDWMLTAEADGDVRLLVGAFENGEMLGVAFASHAEVEDIASNGIELNGLWVYPQYRGRGVSLMLVTHLLDFFRCAGREQVVIYSFHDAPSNRFYRKFGCQVLRQDEQMKERLPVDVFVSDIDALDTAMRRSLSRLSSAN